MDLNAALIHGFNVRDKGLATVDTLEPGLAARGWGCDKDSLDYGWHFLIRVRFFHEDVVDRIVRAIIRGANVLVTHSNGANYAQKALEKLWWFEGVRRGILVHHFSPALDRNTTPPPNVGHCWVYYTEHDLAVKWARLLYKHPWGEQGAVGYKGASPDVTSVNRTREVDGHSCHFRGPNIDRSTNLVDTNTRKHLEAKAAA